MVMIIRISVVYKITLCLYPLLRKKCYYLHGYSLGSRVRFFFLDKTGGSTMMDNCENIAENIKRHTVVEK